MEKFICFFGGDAHCGVTTVAVAAAKALSQKGKRVLLLFASQQAGDAADDAGAADFSALMRLAETDKSDVQRCISKQNGFDYIKGSVDLLKKQFFDPSVIADVLKHCRKDYDYILADAGFDATLALPAACLALSDSRFFVMTGNAKCMRRFHTVFIMLVKGLCALQADDRVLLNKDGAPGCRCTAKELETAFGLSCLSLPYFADGENYEVGEDGPYGRERLFSAAVDRELLPLLLKPGKNA